LIQSIDRAARVLLCLQGARHLGLSEIAGELGLPPSTVHGIVSSLAVHGLVAREPNGTRYMLGPALVKLSSVYLDTHEVRVRALRWADELARRTGLAVRLGVELFDEVMIIHHVAAPGGSQQMPETGMAVQAHACALGKVLLANDPEQAERVMAAGLRAMTGDTVTDPADLREELVRVAAAGVAGELDESVIGEAGLAAPVADRSGTVVAALSVVVPSSRWPTPPEVEEALRETARSLSRELGAPRWPPAPPLADPAA
jgi:DNA-binding IclR family transcriptional regulator